jgi:two-component system NarL family sensor kinase
VRDDGHGFDVAQTAPGVGLYSMRERMALVGGMFTIRSSPEGTEVLADVPHDGR